LVNDNNNKSKNTTKNIFHIAFCKGKSTLFLFSLLFFIIKM